VVVATELTVRSGVVLEKVCEYLYYNQKHSNNKDVSDMDIPPELCLELLIAADYLDGMYLDTAANTRTNETSLNLRASTAESPAWNTSAIHL
jgi:hypothetical protein